VAFLRTRRMSIHETAPRQLLHCPDLRRQASRESSVSVLVTLNDETDVGFDPRPAVGICGYVITRQVALVARTVHLRACGSGRRRAGTRRRSPARSEPEHDDAKPPLLVAAMMLATRSRAAQVAKLTPGVEPLTLTYMSRQSNFSARSTSACATSSSTRRQVFGILRLSVGHQRRCGSALRGPGHSATSVRRVHTMMAGADGDVPAGGSARGISCSVRGTSQRWKQHGLHRRRARLVEHGASDGWDCWLLRSDVSA
jgi:hypothetical protein